MARQRSRQDNACEANRCGRRVVARIAQFDCRVAVANMSGDPGQEYFCDGVSEEILNVLVRNPDMRVIGRGSSFSFKGKNDDLRTIGRKLGVYQLLEGSVRRQANRVRISAHLIRATDGVELWSQSFDRDVSDILQVQSEIADAIAAKLAAKPMNFERRRATDDAQHRRL